MIYRGAAAEAAFEGVSDDEAVRRSFIEHLLAAAAKYQVADLVEFCSSKIAEQLEDANAQSTLELAQKLGLQTLEVHASLLPN